MSGEDVNRRGGGWVEALRRSASGEQNHEIQEISRMLPARPDNDLAQAPG